MRYGFFRDLTFVVPPTSNIFGYPTKFSAHMALSPPPSSEYQVFCHHGRLSKDIARIMPKKTFFTTMLRHPTKQFESMFKFFHFNEKLNTTLEGFLESPRLFFRNGTVPLLRNSMMYDLGLDIEDFDSMAAIGRKILELDKKLDLVMITKYFASSMVLLKDRLGLRHLDVVSTTALNFRKQRASQLSVYHQKLLKEWNAADFMLYEHFARVFRRRSRAFGSEHLRRKINLLRLSARSVVKKCALGEPIDVPKPNQTLSFCEALQYGEMGFTDEIRKKQRPTEASSLVYP